MAFNRVWEFKEMGLVYDLVSAASTLAFYTDMPGGTMAERVIPGTGGGTMSVTTGRETRIFPLDGLNGTQYKAKITPGATSVLKLYAGYLLARPIGVYLEGARGEVWEMQPQALG